MPSTGSADTILIVLRGNSGSGKSTTAKGLRSRLGRGIAWVEQDHLRRILLREHDVPGGINIGLISQTVRYALDHGYHVLLEGLLTKERYESMLSSLHADHRGRTFYYYFDVSFAETERRHAGRPQATQFTTDEMRSWYRTRDLLDSVDERVIPEDAALEDTLSRIISETGITAPLPDSSAIPLATST